ncbi:hypothetical protein [Rosistilla oblonga]|uniref:hypothetical protein n=1 Tax=Rosistilla oblonga TaxID=2527990 RepID=UPI003A96F40E
MNLLKRTRVQTWIALLVVCSVNMQTSIAEDLITIDNGSIKVGIDREKGAAITWLSSAGYPRNLVNIADPGRLIQQSYYAGRVIDRTADGQHKAWSPWSWNPIQGGGVGSVKGQGSWARVTVFEKREDALYSETIPKLWDMADEEAEAVMRQWTTMESNMPGVVRVRCEFQAMRREGDRWGDARMNPQEVPACYFTRNFADVRSYLGSGKWRPEHQRPGPPWGKASPPRQAMAMFEASGQGVALFSPSATEHWNFGPHAAGLSDDPTAGPCMHVAPVSRVLMGPKSIYRYRYWLIVGNETEIAARLDTLWNLYATEKAELVESPQ